MRHARHSARRANGERWSVLVMPRRPWGEASAGARGAQAAKTVARSPDGALHRARDTRCSVQIARDALIGVPTGMAQNPTAAPILFDRALLRARQDRARRGEPATFLLDRVAEDMADRLAAVTRDFSDAAEIWTPGETLRTPLADRFKSIRRIALDDTETLRLAPQS